MNPAKHGKPPLFGFLCASLLMLTPVVGEAGDGPWREPQQQGPLRAASDAAAQPTRHFVRLAAGSLSVKVVDVALVELLDEVSRQAGFAVAPCMACEQKISLQFDRLPLAQGLSTILQDQNFVLRWKYAAAGSLVPHRLWILPQTDSRQSAQLAAPAAQSIGRKQAAIESQASRLRSALSIGAPDDREQAAAAMGQRRDPRAVAPLARALADSDAQVRHAAIESLAEIGGSSATDALALALRDAHPRNREAAVNALGDVGGPRAIALLRQAQTDPTSFVRQAATETLEGLQGASR